MPEDRFEEALIGAGSFVMVEKTSGTWEKLTDISSVPPIGGSRERIEVSNTSSLYKLYVGGMIDSGEMEIETYMYPKEFARLKREIENKPLQFAVWYGGEDNNGVIEPKGQYGKFSWYGTMTMSTDSAAPGDAIKVKLSLINSTAFVWEEGEESV